MRNKENKRDCWLKTKRRFRRLASICNVMRNSLISLALRIQSTSVTDSGFPPFQFPILYRRDPCLVWLKFLRPSQDLSHPSLILHFSHPLPTHQTLLSASMSRYIHFFLSLIFFFSWLRQPNHVFSAPLGLQSGFSNFTTCYGILISICAFLVLYLCFIAHSLSLSLLLPLTVSYIYIYIYIYIYSLIGLLNRIDTYL